MTPASDRNETCPTWTFASAYKYLQALPRQAWKKGYRVRVLNVLSRIAQAPDTPPKWDDVWFTCLKNCGDGSLAEAKRLLSLHDAAPTPAPRCPYFSRAWGVQCDRPAGHDGNCQSGGDGFAPGYTPTPPAPDAAHPALIAAARERDELRERAEKAEARTMPTSREQVVTFLHAVAGHDATLSPPTDEMIDGVWALCKHPATTPLTLAVVAYERGRNFAAMKASAEKAERERDDWRDTSMAAVAAAHGLDWQKVTNEQIDAMEADGKAHGDKKAMDAVRRLYARWNAAVYDADKVRVERDRAEKERDEARESAAAAWRLLDEHRNGCVWITWHKEAEERANAATARAERAEAELRKREAGA